MPNAAKEVLLSTRLFLNTFTLQRSHASTCEHASAWFDTYTLYFLMTICYKHDCIGVMLTI